MKEYLVSLNFLTSVAFKKNQFFKMLEENDFQVSCREANKSLLWRVESKLDESEPLSDHIKSIANAFSPKQFLDHNKFFNQVYFDIGVCYDTLTCSISISNECLKLISDLSPEIGIEIACYPSDEDEEEDE